MNISKKPNAHARLLQAAANVFGSRGYHAARVSDIVAEARRVIEAWRIDYNLHRPHTSLGGLAPTVYANRNRPARPASLELRNGSAQRALTATTSQERNMNRLY
ncbi:MAG: hypothetical protein CMI60_15865 [Parvibaculum sp.]|nr:hypothetical protein [Parvibaculum sp.]|tara:strand:- start:444 stop:755 length:312 start_codon:yes stop_codon:yes gene_type:complete